MTEEEQIRKIRTKNFDPTQLRKKCEKEIGVPCDDPIWSDAKDTARVYPDDNIVAIIVDMRQVTCSSVQIFNTDDDYKGEIDMGDRGYLVIVKWKTEWTFFCVGGCPVGLVRRNEEREKQKNV